MDWSKFRLQQRLVLKTQAVERVYALIAQIDSVKNSWIITQKWQPQTIERLMHHVIVTSTGASNRIEGNRLTDGEVEALYKKLRIQKFKTRDEQEIAGYLEVLSSVFENYQNMPVTESLILQLHRDTLIYSEKDERHRGIYKFGSNRVEAKDQQQGNVVGVIFDPTPPHLVEKEMQELIAWYDWAMNEKVKHPLLLIANFIFEYLAIHPFQDGNGRTSRLITNLVLLQQGYLFTSVVSHEKLIEENKDDYYLALNKTQQSWKTENENLTQWLLYFLTILKKQSEQALELINTDQVESLLSVNQLQILRWARERTNNEFSRKDVVAALELPTRTIEASIKRLVELKQLERLGMGRASRYKLTS